MDTTERRKRVSEEATEWLLVLQGDVSHAQREQFIDWLRESAVHVAEMLRVAQVQGALEQFERWARIPTDGAGDDDEMVVALPTTLRNSTSDADSGRIAWIRNPRFVWPTAAMVVVAAVVVSAVLPYWRGRVIQTERAERHEVALADGTVVQLDPETRLRVKYADRSRRVFLERGRALFRVAKDKDRPFSVEAQDTTVRAVGTAFAVEQQADSILVTVAEGKVEITPAAVPAAAPGSNSERASKGESLRSGARVDSEKNHLAGTDQLGLVKGSRSSSPQIFLTANQQIVVDRSGSADDVRAVNSGRALAWAEGRLIFEYATIADAVRQFNKYNTIQLIVTDPTLAERPINGVFNASDPQSFVAFLQSVTPVRVTRTGGADIALDPVK